MTDDMNADMPGIDLSSDDDPMAEARTDLAVAITEVLIGVAAEDSMSDQDIDDLEIQMTSLADIILEDLGAQIVDYTDGVVTVTFTLNQQ